jgi:hypothetical protein
MLYRLHDSFKGNDGTSIKKIITANGKSRSDRSGIRGIICKKKHPTNFSCWVFCKGTKTKAGLLRSLYPSILVRC